MTDKEKLRKLLEKALDMTVGDVRPMELREITSINF